MLLLLLRAEQRPELGEEGAGLGLGGFKREVERAGCVQGGAERGDGAGCRGVWWEGVG